MLLPRAVPLPPLHILWPRPVGVFEPPVEEPGDPRADGAPPDGVGRGRRRAQQGDEVVFRAWLVWGRAPHVDEGAESSNPLVGCCRTGLLDVPEHRGPGRKAVGTVPHSVVDGPPREETQPRHEVADLRAPVGGSLPPGGCRAREQPCAEAVGRPRGAPCKCAEWGTTATTSA